MKTVNSISALKSQIMKKMEAAVTETVDESFKDLHEWRNDLCTVSTVNPAKL